MLKKMSVGVVLVTYNRKDKLKVALDSFDKQTLLPEFILVVNNASSDGTDKLLVDWMATRKNYDKYVINTESNLGGSGGFNIGLEEASRLSAEWIWVSDDDAFPEANALEETYRFLERYKDTQLSAICGVVLNQGEIAYDHRRNMLRRGFSIIDKNSSPEDYSKEYFEINAFSYVGSIINRNMMLRVGPTIKDYFIWYDDTEHSLRLNSVGKILCVPAIRIHHDTGNANSMITWRDYYGIRNRWDCIHRHFPWYVFYGGTLYHLTKLLIRKIVADNTYVDIALAATWDAFIKKLGIHDVYKPGWKVEDN